MEAIILAGGLGTRLREVIEDLPKPMAPVRGKPFLYYVLDWIKNYDVERVVLSVGYKSQTIIDYFKNTFSSLTIEYVNEEKPLGTGGAIKYALRKTSDENILVINGDTWFPINIEEFYTFHKAKGNTFTVALKHLTDFSRYGNVECQNEIILRFNEKKFCADGLINGGIYLINRSLIESSDLPDIFSLERDIMEKVAGSGILKCKVFDAPFLDIGIPEDYRKAEYVLPEN
jgi:D-glycero-alpha-D-manno-heptose 1-phosphate guanylyltransferase